MSPLELAPDEIRNDAGGVSEVGRRGRQRRDVEDWKEAGGEREGGRGRGGKAIPSGIPAWELTPVLPALMSPTS